MASCIHSFPLRSETLQWLRETGQKSGFLFVNKKGQKITARGIAGQLKHFAVLYDLAPTVVYPHSFRSRFHPAYSRCPCSFITWIT